MISDLNLKEIAADPFVQTGLLALVGALLTHVLLRHYPARRLIVQVTFFVALTVLLLHYNIIPYEVAPADTPVFERVFVALSKIIWWANAAWVLIGCVRVFLIFEQMPREGRLIQDLLVATIYLGAGLSVVAYVFSAPVGTLIATSGVFAIILGLALQSTLSDVFSGIALNLSRPYSVGDWIVLDGEIEGRVVETNWRATHLLNGSNDLVVLPNSGLAKARLTNLSSPNRSHGVTLTRPRGADGGAVDDFRRHEDGADEQQFHPGHAGAGGADQVARCPGDRVRAVVPRQGFQHRGDGEARGLRPDLSPHPGGRFESRPAEGGIGGGCRAVSASGRFGIPHDDPAHARRRAAVRLVDRGGKRGAGRDHDAPDLPPGRHRGRAGREAQRAHGHPQRRASSFRAPSTTTTSS